MTDRPLTKKEKLIIKQGVENLCKLFEKYQACETIYDVKKINDENESKSNSGWFREWETLFNKINKL